MPKQNESKSDLLIILASTSPRRLDLVKQVRLPVIVIAPDADETPFRGEKPKQLVQRLSLAKALSAQTMIRNQNRAGFIVAADTIVVSPQGKKVLGKPADSTEARRMLKSLSGKTHSVLTGYCILNSQSTSKKEPWVRVVETKVKMRQLTEKTIADYISTGEPMDKAGSYGAQGIGGALIEKIEGSFTNVVGLPITEILKDLEVGFKIKPLSWL